MRSYFGTDGIRGAAGIDLTADLALRTGLVLSHVLRQETPCPQVLIGRDTRLSGPMLEAALMAGLMAGGCRVTPLGVLPTPALAWLTAESAAGAGVMISASHNPFEDNGIKIFGPQGFKLTDGQEAELEALLDGPAPPAATGGDIGTVVPFAGDPAALYAGHMRQGAPHLSGLRLVIDCANGAACATARQIFPTLGADCTFMGDTPDGFNINAGCGSTHLEGIQAKMAEGGFHLGLAFDGDADRFLAVDEQGAVMDGDRILAILATHLHGQGRMRGDLVATQVSNLGLHASMAQLGLGVRATRVGDRYVLEEMRRCGSNLGGEQSGHVIFLDRARTGDGQLTALLLLEAMLADGRPASRMAADIELFPQTTVNVAVPGAIKGQIAALPEVAAVAAQIEAAFGGSGRVLIRPSGTEAKVRVMVEGRDAALVAQLAQKAVAVIEQAAKKA